LQWTFRWDDWLWVSDAGRMPFLQYVTRVYNGHLQPGQFAIVWVVTRIAPLNYTLAMVPVLITTLVGGVLMWRLLRALFGERPANLIPLAVFMLCPLSLSVALWWTTALGIITLQALIVGTLLTVLLYVRAPTTPRLIIVGVVYGVALLFWEKSLLILPLVVLFVLLFLGEGKERARLRNVSLGLWRLWALLAGLTAAYAAWYVAVVNWRGSSGHALLQISRLARTVLGSTVIPTYVGGPWSVGRLASVLPSPSSNLRVYELPLLPRLATWAALVVIVGLSFLLMRQAWRAWLMLAVYLGMCFALVIAGRLNLLAYTPIGLDARYVADSVPVFALAIALAFMVPLDRRGDSAWSRRPFSLDVAFGERSSLAESHRGGGVPIQWGIVRSQRVLAVALVVVYAVSAMITSSTMAGLASAYSVKQWFSTVRSQIAAHPTASVYDGFLPARALSARYYPQVARLSGALKPVAPHIRWDAPGETMLIFDEKGVLRPVEVAGGITSERRPGGGCGYRVDGAALRVPLTGELSAGTWGVWVAYFATATTPGYVTVDGDRQGVAFIKGIHPLTLVHNGTATSVTVESLGRVCIGTVRVGRVAAG
jgi:hypothetical protein